MRKNHPLLPFTFVGTIQYLKNTEFDSVGVDWTKGELPAYVGDEMIYLVKFQVIPK